MHELPGRLDHERAVHQEELLLRHLGEEALARRHARVREVELGEHLRRVPAVDEGVDGPAGGEAPAADRHGPAAHGQVDRPRDREDRVVQLLEVELPHVAAPLEPVVGIRERIDHGDYLESIITGGVIGTW